MSSFFKKLKKEFDEIVGDDDSKKKDESSHSQDYQGELVFRALSSLPMTLANRTLYKAMPLPLLTAPMVDLFPAVNTESSPNLPHLAITAALHMAALPMVVLLMAVPSLAANMVLMKATHPLHHLASTVDLLRTLTTNLPLISPLCLMAGSLSLTSSPNAGTTSRRPLGAPSGRPPATTPLLLASILALEDTMTTTVVMAMAAHLMAPHTAAGMADMVGTANTADTADMEDTVVTAGMMEDTMVTVATTTTPATMANTVMAARKRRVVPAACFLVPRVVWPSVLSAVL